MDLIIEHTTQITIAIKMALRVIKIVFMVYFFDLISFNIEFVHKHKEPTIKYVATSTSFSK